jgi:hypothetical protein
MQEIVAKIMERRTDNHLFQGVTKLYVGDSCNDLHLAYAKIGRMLGAHFRKKKFCHFASSTPQELL